MKSTEVLLAEQERQHKTANTRLVRSWNAQKQEYEAGLKSLQHMERANLELKDYISKLEFENRQMKKSQKVSGLRFRHSRKYDFGFKFEAFLQWILVVKSISSQIELQLLSLVEKIEKSKKNKIL